MQNNQILKKEYKCNGCYRFVSYLIKKQKYFKFGFLCSDCHIKLDKKLKELFFPYKFISIKSR